MFTVFVKQRQPGYYWIKYDGKAEIAEYAQSNDDRWCWWRCGETMPCAQKESDVVLSDRLLPPDWDVTGTQST